MFIPYRVQAYTRINRAKHVIDPVGRHTGYNQQGPLPSTQLANVAWRHLKVSFTATSPIYFTDTEIVNNFMLMRGNDFMAAGDVRGMIDSALNLFCLQEITCCSSDQDHICI